MCEQSQLAILIDSALMDNIFQHALQLVNAINVLGNLVQHPNSKLLFPVEKLHDLYIEGTKDPNGDDISSFGLLLCYAVICDSDDAQAIQLDKKTLSLLLFLLDMCIKGYI